MFSSFKHKLSFDCSQTMYPSQLQCIQDAAYAAERPSSHYYIFVLDGQVKIKSDNAPDASLSKNMFFSAPGSFEVSAKGQFVVIERMGYRGLRQIGGPVEQDGRLAYIDNCRTTILVPPARLGDPVFNFLVFPPNTTQSLHCHPSIRLGIVIEGEGEARFPKEKPLRLKTGMVFVLPQHEIHSFNTKNSSLKIIAYHPDSDTGPSDHDHPMLNRTYLTSGHESK